MSGTDEDDEAADIPFLFPDTIQNNRPLHQNHHNNDDDNNHDEQPLEEEDEPPLPRHHSYLPGELQAMDTTAADNAGETSFSSSKQKHGTPMEMILNDFPILELPNIIVFPGATLPIRLTERLWVEYISREIRNHRTIPGTSTTSTCTSIRLGVLCLDPHVDSIAASQQRLHPDHTRPRRRRRFWFRRTFGPTRLQRLSMQLLQELGRDAFQELEEDDDDEGQNNNNNNNNNETTTLALTNGTDPQQPQQQYRTATVRLSQDHASSSSSSSNSSSSALSPTEQAMAQRNRQRQIRRRNRRQQHQQQVRRQPQDDPSRYVGRVGTIATVLFVHGPENLQERIITTYGTGRFQILAKASSSLSEMGIPRFRVREISDEIWKIPSYPRFCHHNIANNRNQASTDSFAHESFVRYLSQVSSIPHSVISLFWPWRLMAEIRSILKTTPWLQALDKALPPDETTTTNNRHHDVDAPIVHDPVRFSFWMAQNLPIPQSEKLALFETIGIVERLQWILDIVSEEASEEAVMHCRNCLTPIARARDLFTVGGAEGTSGNYVNEYGCVHQTITLRSMDENEVWYQGRPEIRDSWFPGYSWTIMNCSVCGHHLGWKFLRLLGRNASISESLHRPNQFFGVSAANVTTFVPSQHSFEEEEEED
jgi:cereblon